MEIRNKYNVINIMENLANSDLGRVIAGYKFYDLINTFNAAVFSLNEGSKCSDCANKRFYFFKNSILEFNSCYDYFWQIVYFAFDFFEDIKSEEDYQKLLKKECAQSIIEKNPNGDRIYVQSKFAKTIEYLKQNNPEAQKFFSVFNKYISKVSDDKIGIKQWANNMKHQGGFIAEEILLRDNTTFIDCFSDDKLSFSTKWLYPMRHSFDEIERRLGIHKDNIEEFEDWLFRYIYGDTQVIDFKNEEKKFSAKQCRNVKYSHIIPYSVMDADL